MKLQTLPVKRRPVPKGVFKRLSAVTRKRKQRVAAAVPASDMDGDEGSSKIGKKGSSDAGFSTLTKSARLGTPVAKTSSMLPT